MEEPRPLTFAFGSRACPEAGFQVVRFEGEEALGRCYRFRIELASERQDLDPAALVGGRATLRMLRRERPELAFHGVVARFRQLHQAPPFCFYEAVLVPRLHLLSLSRHNQVFLDQSLPEFIAACLKDGGLEARDFRFALARDPGSWEQRDFLCQYGESHLDFVQRWLEREGLYYFFEQEDGEERVVITDSRIAHRSRTGEPEARYHPASGLAALHAEEVVTAFHGCCRRGPARVVVQGGDELRPDLEVRGEAAVAGPGFGTAASFGEPCRTPAEATRLARAWAEAEACQATRFEGRGSAPFLQPGWQFRLGGHYRAEWDGDYLAVAVRHRGSQAGFMLAGLERDPGAAEPEPGYENQFTALPAAVQFRPPRETPWPRIDGFLSATVDGEGDGVHLDEWSRYKVILPFDRSGRGGGKASAWVRMLTPYAGAGYGWNSPLHKGTEVLLSFIEGDPDRPVIAGAVPNPRTPSPVNADNPTQVVLRTAGGHQLAFEDQPGKESIRLECGDHGSAFRLGAVGGPGQGPAGPPGVPPLGTGVGNAQLATPGPVSLKAGSVNEMIRGMDFRFIVGLSLTRVFGATVNIYVGAYVHLAVGRTTTVEEPEELNFSPTREHLRAIEEKYREIAELKSELSTSVNDSTRVVNQINASEKIMNQLENSNSEKLIKMETNYRNQEKSVQDSQEKIAKLKTRIEENLKNNNKLYTTDCDEILKKFDGAYVQIQNLTMEINTWITNKGKVGNIETKGTSSNEKNQKI